MKKDSMTDNHINTDLSEMAEEITTATDEEKEDIDNFLVALQRDDTPFGDGGDTDGLSVRLCRDGAGRVYVDTTDDTGRHVTPDYHSCGGELFMLLRAFAAVRQQSVVPGDDGRIYLDEHTELMPLLQKIDCLADADGNAITAGKEMLRMTAVITKSDDGRRYSVSFRVDGTEAGYDEFTLITDSWVTAGGRLWRLGPLGSGWRQTAALATDMPEEWLAGYVSVLSSTLDNTDIICEGYDVVRDDEPVDSVPMIDIEKVDDDQTLYMNFRNGVPGLDTAFTDRFDITYAAAVTPDRKIVIRRVRSSNAGREEFIKLICGFSPTAKDKADVYVSGQLVMVPPATAGPFLLGALPQLMTAWNVTGLEKLAAYKIKMVQPRLSVHLKSGIDYLEGDATVDMGGETLAVGDFIRQMRRNHYVKLGDGTRAIAGGDYAGTLERVFRDTGKDGHCMVSFFDLPEMAALLPGDVHDEAVRKAREVYEGFNRLAASRQRCGTVKATLRQYQKAGVRWMRYLHDNNLGGCLADDMGLGKTLQAIAMLTCCYPAAGRPSLVVMPRTLLFNWQDELARFAPQLTVATYYGPGRDIEKAVRCNIVLTTYATVRNDADVMQERDFEYVILDEAQNIKNVQSQTTAAVWTLHGAHRLALSGTPVENNLTELYSLFTFLNPTMFGSMAEFNRLYTYPIQRERSQKAMDALKRKIYPFMLRRLKRDVLTELPPVTEKTIYVEMEQRHAELYEARRLYFRQSLKKQIDANGVSGSQFVMLQAIGELRRLASIPESLTDGRIESPKLGPLADSIAEAAGNGHKTVVFFNFIAGIELLAEKLEARGIGYAVMTGSTTDREGVVRRFQTDSRCKVMIMTLKTGGTGLNLTVADTVIIAEPWWNKTAERQAVDRLHRFGQKAAVMSYSMITRGTIEEKIQQLQKNKSDIIDSLITSDGAAPKHLSEQDIEQLLGK